MTNIGVTNVNMDGLAWGPSAAVSIATGEVNDGSFSWTVPDSTGNASRIKITAHDTGGHSTSDMTDGYFHILDTVDADLPGPPARTFLSAAAPNPFQSQTTIRFGLARAGKVRLSVYDVRGRLTRVLLAGEQPAGRKSLTWDGRDQSGVRVGSGNYVIQLKTEHDVYTQRVNLVR